LVCGGTFKIKEGKKLQKGVDLLIATPGRLVDHIISTQNWSLEKTKLFILDEADKILSESFDEQIKEIISHLPKPTQTALFSATLSPNILSMIDILFTEEPLFISTDSEAKYSTSDLLTQSYVVVSAAKKLLVLITFLNRHKKSKIMVFFSTRSSTKFHQLFFAHLKITTLAIHGDQAQAKRIEVFDKFREQKFGILLCTDVAARGLDIPKVDWIVQYDPPSSTKEYIHRVGRSARAGEKGKAILFLLKNEKRFLNYLKEERVPLKELKITDERLLKINTVLYQLSLKISPFIKLLKKLFEVPFKDMKVILFLNVSMLKNLISLDYPNHLDLLKCRFLTFEF
jgi:ATP-dependent RNA helicase DDX18/HAS1